MEADEFAFQEGYQRSLLEEISLSQSGVLFAHCTNMSWTVAGSG